MTSTKEAKTGAASSSSWQRPIPSGTEPAYDEALRYISSQQESLQGKIHALRTESEKLTPGSRERTEADARLKSHIIASQINDPEVRWKFEHNVDADLSNPVFSHLYEKSWREQVLPRTLERIRLMKVLPDVLSSITPVVDVQVAFGQGEGFHDHGGDAGPVLTGCFVCASKTLQPPKVTVTPFHTDDAYYTLAMVDTDAPYEAEDRLASKAHWLVHNIPLSVTKTQVDVSKVDVSLPYIAPHPQRGTPYHRYTLVLLSQPGKLTIPPTPLRDHFSLRQLIEDHHLSPAGIHFWRAAWSEASSEAISSVYRNVLHEEEPHFVKEHIVNTQ